MPDKSKAQRKEFQEPWEFVADDSASTATAYLLYSANDDEGLWVGEITELSYAARIVACVNACRGISTEDLACGVVPAPTAES